MSLREEDFENSEVNFFSLRVSLQRERGFIHLLSTSIEREVVELINNCSEYKLNIVAKVLYCIVNGFIVRKRTSMERVSARGGLKHLHRFKSYKDFAKLTKEEKVELVRPLAGFFCNLFENFFFS